MSTPKSTPALEALRLHVIGLVNQAFDDASLLGIIPAATPAQPSQVLPPGKMKKSILDRIIGSQYEDWISNRATYNVKEFRQHCEPLLCKHFRREDLEPDHDGAFKWYGRFAYAHKDIAGQYDYIHDSGGVYVMCSC
jgi:hypothetical protein